MARATTYYSSKSVKDAAKWVGAMSNWVSAAAAVVEFAASIGGGETPEQRVERLLYELYEGQKHIEDVVSDLGSTVSRIAIGNEVAVLDAKSTQARRDLMTLPSIPESSRTAYLDGSMTALTTIATNTALWEHIHTEHLTHGEWLTITDVRPAMEGQHTWEYRWALPALMSGIAMRLNVLAAVDPVRLDAGVYKLELEGYRDKLIGIKQKIELGLKCGFEVAIDVGLIPMAKMEYQLHSICGDPYTGQEVIRTYTMQDKYLWEIPFSAVGAQHLDVFAPRWLPIVYDFHTSAVLFSVGQLRDRFWAQFTQHPGYANIMSGMQATAYAKLRDELGLFEIQRVIDYLATITMKDPGPLSYDRLRAAFPGICLSHRLSLSGGLNYAVTATCDSPMGHTYGQAWVYDAPRARFWNQSSGLCLSIEGAIPYIPGFPAIAEACDETNNSQRWSYDPTTKRVRNAGGAVLDIYNGNNTPGTMVWTYWDTGSIAQQWGFRSPWVTTGTGGPF